jgi:Endosomal/lysosomal potassium channel TMEM175
VIIASTVGWAPAAVGYRTRVDRKGRVKMASEREASVDRVIAFSDGVVAIAITLLILPLTEIERLRAQPLPT